MARALDITNMRSGMLVAVRRSSKQDAYGHTYWLCKCDCGRECYSLPSRIKDQSMRSCGCSKYKNHFIKHGMTNTRLYKTWQDMKSRCFRRANKDYMLYGGRGITVCKEWLHDFQTFHDWAIVNGYENPLEIDRINTNGNYEPSNCRFATRKEQTNNTRSNRFLSYNGEVHTMSEWCDKLGFSYTVVRSRLNQCHWSVEKALSTPVRKVVWSHGRR